MLGVGGAEKNFHSVVIDHGRRLPRHRGVAVERWLDAYQRLGMHGAYGDCAPISRSTPRRLAMMDKNGSARVYPNTYAVFGEWKPCSVESVSS